MTLTFHGMVPKEWIAGEVRTRADKLEDIAATSFRGASRLTCGTGITKRAIASTSGST